jgi:hypothetical protein
MTLKTFKVLWEILGTTEETAAAVNAYTAEEAAEKYCEDVFNLNPNLRSEFPAKVRVLRPDGKIENVLVGHKSLFFSIEHLVQP